MFKIYYCSIKSGLHDILMYNSSDILNVVWGKSSYHYFRRNNNWYNPLTHNQNLSLVVRFLLLVVRLKTNNQQLITIVGKQGLEASKRFNKSSEQRVARKSRARLQPCETKSRPKGLPYILAAIYSLLNNGALASLKRKRSGYALQVLPIK